MRYFTSNRDLAMPTLRVVILEPWTAICLTTWIPLATPPSLQSYLTNGVTLWASKESGNLASWFIWPWFQIKDKPNKINNTLKWIFQAKVGVRRSPRLCEYCLALFTSHDFSLQCLGHSTASNLSFCYNK